MDCLHKFNPPPVWPSNPALEMEQYEEITIQKIKKLVNPLLFPDRSGAISLIKDPFGEAINLAKTLTAAKKEDVLVYITGYFPATSSDRAYQTLELIETQEKRNKAIEKIQVMQFRAHLKQKEFASARIVLTKLPIKKLYYHWVYVKTSLEQVQLEKALDYVKNVDLLEETFDFVKNIPDSFHHYPNMSSILEKIGDKFLLIGSLEKALVAARMMTHQRKCAMNSCEKLEKPI